jgi:hypothetical protein
MNAKGDLKKAKSGIEMQWCDSGVTDTKSRYEITNSRKGCHLDVLFSKAQRSSITLHRDRLNGSTTGSQNKPVLKTKSPKHRNGRNWSTGSVRKNSVVLPLKSNFGT